MTGTGAGTGGALIGATGAATGTAGAGSAGGAGRGDALIWLGQHSALHIRESTIVPVKSLL